MIPPTRFSPLKTTQGGKGSRTKEVTAWANRPNLSWRGSARPWICLAVRLDGWKWMVDPPICLPRRYSHWLNDWIGISCPRKEAGQDVLEKSCHNQVTRPHINPTCCLRLAYHNMQSWVQLFIKAMWLVLSTSLSLEKNKGISYFIHLEKYFLDLLPELIIL